MSEEIAIKVENVSKNFKLPHEKHSSLKSKIVHSFSRTRGFQTQHALKDVSFEVKKGEFFGIVGRNGSGKSTLLKMLAGIYQPTEGKISVSGRLVPFIELGVGFNPELTGRENVFLNGALLGCDNKQVAKMYDEIVEFAELESFMDQKLKNYSSGMQVRLAFSMAVRAKADVLLIDEVLAVGDSDFQRKCFSYFKLLKKKKITVIFVSHDMGAVKEFCEQAALIKDARLVSVGPSAEIATEYQKLFTKDNIGSRKSAGKTQRWGRGDATYVSTRTKVKGDYIEITTNIEIKKDLDKIVYGLHILSADGVEVTAMNNRMIKSQDIKNAKKGETIKLMWSVMNVFNDGEYRATLTLVDDTWDVLDWWVEATGFTVVREERSTTAVLPPVTAKYNKVNSKGKKV